MNQHIFFLLFNFLYFYITEHRNLFKNNEKIRKQTRGEKEKICLISKIHKFTLILWCISQQRLKYNEMFLFPSYKYISYPWPFKLCS